MSFPDIHSPPVVLVIAGSDSGGGAGIQADIKAISAMGAFATTAITAVTAQNTLGVQAVHTLPANMVTSQINAISEDMKIRAIKTGMLANRAIIEAVIEACSKLRPLPLIVDPVIYSQTGHRLLDENAIDLMLEKLFPMADLITPNATEAERLLGETVTTLAQAEKACHTLMRFGPKAVLLKGGHMKTDKATDVLYHNGAYQYFETERIPSPHTHGGGDSFASAIAAHLAHGRPLEHSVREAKRFITEAIQHGLAIGHGPGPVNGLYRV